MTPIRPLEHGDLETVARLYELVVRSGSEEPPPDLASRLGRALLDQPWTDAEIPSLVYEDSEQGIVAFLGSHPRRLRAGGRRLRLGCSGQLVAHPGADMPGVGALLLRRYLAGPQDLTITDGATEQVREMWERLGGSTNGLCSVGWTRIFRPGRFARLMVERRRGRELPLPAIPAAHARPPARPEGSTEPLTPAELVALLPTLERTFRVVPDYDEDFLTWLLDELSAVEARGELACKLVTAADGRTVGSYAYYLKRGGVSQVQQLAVAPEDARLVLDHLLREAADGGSAAIQGRVEPHLLAALFNSRCLFRRSEWALIASRDPELLASVTLGHALLTRLEGEWWMGYHLR